MSHKKLKLLQVAVLDVHLCIDYQYLERILPLALLERVPGGAPYLAGLMNLQGKSIPIIDLALRLGLPRDLVYSLNTPILLCSSNHQQVGLIIDQIFGFVEVEEESLQMHDEFTQKNTPFLGTIVLETGVWLLINIGLIFENKKEFILSKELLNLAKNNG